MAKLSSDDRKKLKTNQFALPQKAKSAKGKATSGSYPIPDRGHARSALSFVSRYGTPAEKKQVRGAVARKYGMGPSAKKRGGSSRGRPAR